ncbi:MAG: hypothetical protein RSD47_06360 [Romboutsia sp.]
MNENNNFDDVKIDFKKMNETLANPDFANWYYHQIIDNMNESMTVENFIKIVQEYNENKFE